MPVPQSKQSNKSNKSNGWEPTPGQWASLDETGQQFVSGYLDRYDVSTAEGGLLIELAHVASRLAELRTVRRDPLATARERAACDRLEQGWQRLYASITSQLKADAE